MNGPPRELIATRFGSLLRRRRLAAGLTQVDLAAQIDTTQVMVSTWERGGSMPADATRARLIAVLGITPDELAAVYAEPDTEPEQEPAA